jgi:hypothetical protein
MKSLARRTRREGSSFGVPGTDRDGVRPVPEPVGQSEYAHFRWVHVLDGKVRIPVADASKHSSTFSEEGG